MSVETHDARAQNKYKLNTPNVATQSVGLRALYREVEGDHEKIPWADLEPNKFLRRWSDKTNLKGDGRTVLVVGCGLATMCGFCAI